MDAQVSQVMDVTGVAPERARALLEACDNSVEAAIHLQLSSGDVPTSSSTERQTSSSLDQPPVIPPEEPEIRAPIKPKKDTLIDMPAPRTFRRRPVAASAVHHPFISFTPDTSQETRQRLGSLFAPPEDIMCPLPWDQTVEKAQEANKWLLVNIQSTSQFESHRLNRDVWKDDMVKSVVQASFVFWQMDEHVRDGAEFLKKYPAPSLPHVCAIDPFTRERVEQFKTSPTAEAMLDALLAFVDKYGSPSTKPSPSAASSSSADSSSGKQQPAQEGGEIVDLTNVEDEMLRAAMAASKADAKRQEQAAKRAKHATAMATDEDEEEDDDETQCPRVVDLQESDDDMMAAEDPTTHQPTVKPRPEPSKDTKQPTATICLVFPDGSRFQRRFYADEPVAVLADVIRSNSAADSNLRTGDVHAMRSHPRVDLLAAPRAQTFADLNIRRELVRVEASG